MRCAYATTKGIKPKNEDSILVGSRVVTEGSGTVEDEATIFAVSDGVSSNKGGDIASKLVLDELSKLNNENVNKTLIENVIIEAKNKMIGIIQNNNAYKDMAATLSCVIIKDDIKVFNLGDSPIYIYKFNSLRKISQEHTLFNDMLTAGLIDEADTKVNRHVITKYVDAFHKFPFELKENIKLNNNDYILISSDGLTETVNEEIIENVLSSDASLQEKVNGLLSLSLARGTTDNVSIILIKV